MVSISFIHLSPFPFLQLNNNDNNEFDYMNHSMAIETILLIIKIGFFNLTLIAFTKIIMSFGFMSILFSGVAMSGIVIDLNIL